MDKIKNIEGNVADVELFLKGLASRHRLLILCQLASGEKSVTELIDLMGMAQTSMSQHLLKLKKENIIDFRRDHRTLYYSIKNGVVFKIMDILRDEFCSQTKKEDK